MRDVLSSYFDNFSLRVFVRELHSHGFRKRALVRGQFFHKRLLTRYTTCTPLPSLSSLYNHHARRSHRALPCSFRRDSRPQTLSQIQSRSTPSSSRELHEMAISGQISGQSSRSTDVASGAGRVLSPREREGDREHAQALVEKRSHKKQGGGGGGAHASTKGQHEAHTSGHLRASLSGVPLSKQPPVEWDKVDSRP